MIQLNLLLQLRAINGADYEAAETAMREDLGHFENSIQINYG